MDFILALMILILAIWLDRRTRHIEAELRKNTRAFELMMRSRQSSIPWQRVSEKDPEVDSRATTTRRDTPDIPLTGRMSKISQSDQEGTEYVPPRRTR